jgi:hypothetical protein
MYIEKKIASWEVQYGQILFSGQNNVIAREMFKDFFGRQLKLYTFKGNYNNVKLLDKLTKSNVRLCCSQFVKQLKTDDIIFIYSEEYNTIKISRDKPQDIMLSKHNTMNNYSEDELKNIIIKQTMEIQSLKEYNSELLEYKEQIEKYESLDKIFKDEKFMEDWLARNIHKVVSDLEVIDRQISVTWKDMKRSRFDLLCIDKTTKELVIVENKVRNRNKTLETQYLTYKAWIAKNLDIINQKYQKFDLKATNEFKFIIITDSLDTKTQEMCEGNDIPLIYINGGVIFEPIVPYE